MCEKRTQTHTWRQQADGHQQHMFLFMHVQLLQTHLKLHQRLQQLHSWPLHTNTPPGQSVCMRLCVCVVFLWIVGTFHRLLLILYWPNDIFYPVTLTLPLTENLFAFLHFQINIITIFNNFFPSWGPQSPQCQKCQVLLSLWGHLVPSM